MGIAVSLTLFLPCAGEGDRELMLLVVLILASTGVGMYLSTSKRTAQRGGARSLQARVARTPADAVNRPKQRSLGVGN